MVAFRRIDDREELAGLSTRGGSDDSPFFLVRGFDLAEDMIRRGVESRRVLPCPEGREDDWSARLEGSDADTSAGSSQAGSVEAVPPEPYWFPWQNLVVLPTYNERENLENMVSAIRTHIGTDILVVDDNSPDGTGRLADKLATTKPWLHVLHRTEKDGLGRAYVAGFRWGLERKYDRIYEMDCDFSHSPRDLPRLAAASADADLVIGSRYVRGGGTENWPFRRRFLSKGANTYTRFILGRRVNDWTGGFRCYRAELLASLDLSKVGSAGYSFQVEMLWHCMKQGAQVREIPILFKDRIAGESKMDLSIAFEGLRLVPRLRFGSKS
ncbi:MAG: polyprenol monophosphomannose synthase [Planctomycetota bacterium]